MPLLRLDLRGTLLAKQLREGDVVDLFSAVFHFAGFSMADRVRRTLSTTDAAN
jgi:hypothetical protein